MSEKISLLNDSSDSEVDFTINKSYADSYNTWRNKEELQKLKDLSKDVSDSSSSSSEEDDPEIEEDFLKTLSLLKSKDPKIYDTDVRFFKEQSGEKKPKVHKPKPVFMKDYERKLVLERNGELSDEDDHLPSNMITYSEEQEELKRSFKAALHDSSDESDDKDDLLQERQKTKVEKDSDEAEYLRWLKGQEEKVSKETEKEMSFLRKYWNDPKLDDGERFLKDFILNKKYIVDENDGIPTYDEITGDVEMLKEDEKVLEQQEMFEHKYNFRFEEPDDEFIKRYPRTVGDSLRRVDTRRKAKREEYSERKKREKDQKTEELKRLKALKRKEIEEKFMKLKEVSGRDEINLDENDIESDFDPDKHDQKMQELFNDDYYKVQEEEMPQFSFDEELDDENWNSWTREKIKDNNEDDSCELKDPVSGSTVGGAKNDPKEDFEKEMIGNTQKKKSKKKTLFAKVISEPKPLFDPDGKSFEQYLDDYYKLDYEDIIGDMPVRYKYRKVVPNSFGLSVDEILTANDRELNRWCSVKKTCQYRDEDEELYDVQAFQKKAQNEFTKKKVFQSLYSEPEKNQTENANTNCKKEHNTLKAHDFKKIKKKSKGMKESYVTDNNTQSMNDKIKLTSEENSIFESTSLHSFSSKSKKRKHCDSELSTEEGGMDKSFKAGVSENVEQKSKKRKKNNDLEKSQVISNFDQSMQSEDQSSVSEKSHVRDSTNKDVNKELISNQSSESSSPKKRKKKKKKKAKLNEQSMQKSNNSFTKSQNVSKTQFSQQKHFKQGVSDERLHMSDARLAAYGINPKKFKGHIKYSQK